MAMKMYSTSKAQLEHHHHNHHSALLFGATRQLAARNSTRASRALAKAITSSPRMVKDQEALLLIMMRTYRSHD